MSVKDKRRPIEEPIPDWRPADSIFVGRCYYCGSPTRGIVCLACDRKHVGAKQ